jgi:hypothetical protein
VPAKVKAKPEPKAEAPKPPVNETRQDKARRLWAGMSEGTATSRKHHAQQLRDFKKAAKSSWDSLGLGKQNVEAELKKLLD